MKLKRVNDSKVPTINQLSRMTYNLRALYGFATIHLHLWGHTGTINIKTEHWLGVESQDGKWYSWEELLSKYRELIKEGLNVRNKRQTSL